MLEKVRAMLEAHGNRQAQFKAAAELKQNHRAIREANAVAYNALDLAGATYTELLAEIGTRMKRLADEEEDAGKVPLPVPVLPAKTETFDVDKQRLVAMMVLNVARMKVVVAAVNIEARQLQTENLERIADNSTNSLYELATAEADGDVLKDVLLKLFKKVVIEVIDVSNIIAVAEAFDEAVKRKQRRLDETNKYLNGMDDYANYAMRWSIVMQEVLDLVRGEEPEPTYERAMKRANDRLAAVLAGTWTQP